MNEGFEDLHGDINDNGTDESREIFVPGMEAEGDRMRSFNVAKIKLMNGNIIAKGEIVVDRKNEGDPYTMYLRYDDNEGIEREIQIAFVSPNTEVAMAVMDDFSNKLKGKDMINMPTEVEVQESVQKVMGKLIPIR